MIQFVIFVGISTAFAISFMGIGFLVGLWIGYWSGEQSK